MAVSNIQAVDINTQNLPNYDCILIYEWNVKVKKFLVPKYLIMTIN